jgi:hypothetical protein
MAAKKSDKSLLAEAVENAAADLAAFDHVALTARVDAVLNEELYWFPVRHHSPAIAAQIADCIRQRRPKVVFIEGPYEAQEMIEFLVDAKTRPPVAIYSSFRDDAAAAAAPDGLFATPPRYSCWYPLVSYSPELIAMQAARSVGAKVVFMDLPHYAIERPEPVAAAGSAPPAGQPAPKTAPARRRRDLYEIAETSQFYRLLTKAAGYRSWDETWDALFETPRAERGHEGLRREVAIFCAALRATVDPASLVADGTLARERFMWKTIRETLAESKIAAQDAMVVCGGFHVFLDRNDPEPHPPIPAGTLSVTVAPYSYFRISELSGYAAGNRAPRYYEMCFDSQSAAGDQTQVVIDYVIDVVKEARKRGERLSPADAISATQHALLLARLRGRRAPVLDDVVDALITCCCKGNPQTEGAHLHEAIDEVNIGTRLGRVTDRIGRLPIVNDFYEQLDRLALDEVVAREKVCSYTLDKRQPQDLARSAFLHRLVFLGLEIGGLEREAAPFGQSVFKEHWRLKWSPKLEAVLIERNLHGDTVESAATTLLGEGLGARAHEAGPACRGLVQAVDMDLPRLVAQAEQMTGHAIDHDDRFFSLADALTSLMLLERYAVYRGMDRQRLDELMTRCFDRACFALPDAASVPAEEWENVINGLLALAEPVMQRTDLDAELFAAHVQRAAAVSTMPLLRGAFLGVLTELRRMKPEGLAAELSAYARGPVEQQVAAGDFLQGVLRVSKTAILLGATSLVAAVDELLRVAEGDTFLCIVPRLRAAFETLHQRQRDSLATHVAELYGLKESDSPRTLATSIGAAQLMAELDAAAAAILGEWLQKVPSPSGSGLG